MSAVFEAHLRLMTMLRDRIRTHQGGQPHRGQGKRIGEIPRPMLVEFARLRQRGLRETDIRRIMHIGSVTYRRMRIALERETPPE